jgi:hypothetical protein
LDKKSKNKPHKTVTEASQESNPLEYYNIHQKEVVEGEAIIFYQEPSKRRNELQLQKSPQQG